MYDGYGKPMPLGVTQDQRTMVIVKRQLIQEAEAATDGAKVVGDEILTLSFQGSLDKLKNTLDALIPPELEELYVNDGPDTD
jgi:hypothetical protein